MIENDKYVDLVKYLKTLDLESTSIEHLYELFNENTGHLCTTRLLPAGTKIFRAIIYEELPKKLPNNVKEISYNPTPSKSYGRCNIVDEIKFYGCMDNPFFIDKIDNQFHTWNNAVLETVKLNKELISRKYFVVSEWILKKEFRVANLKNELIHGEEINNVRRKFIQSHPEYLTNFSECFDSFIAEEFSKTVDYDYEYKISAAYSLFLKNNGIEGIEYPSVKTNGAALNLSINKEIIDKSILMPNHIIAGTIYSRYTEVYFEYTMKGEFSNRGNIIWEDLSDRLNPSEKIYSTALINYYTGLVNDNPDRKTQFLDLDKPII